MLYNVCVFVYFDWIKMSGEWINDDYVIGWYSDVYVIL